MIDLAPRDYEGEIVVVLFWAMSDTGDDDVRRISGRATLHDGLLYVQHRTGFQFEIRDEWMDRIKRLDDEDLSIKLGGAKYCLSLRVGDWPDACDEELRLQEWETLEFNWDDLR